MPLRQAPDTWPEKWRLISVLHVTEDHSVANTGITRCVNELATALSDDGAKTAIVAVGPPCKPIGPGVPIKHAPYAALGGAWRWSPQLRPMLQEASREIGADVFHLHGIWMAPQFIGAGFARERGLPAVLTSHGALTAWALDNKSPSTALKKRMYLAIAGRRFRRIDVLHAITPNEREGMHRLFRGARIEIIPNALDPGRINDALKGRERVPNKDILFVGRLHPVKGLELLVEAFCRAALPAEARLVIVGPDSSPGYGRKLRARAAQSAAAERIVFAGAKWDATLFYDMQDAHVVALPSFTEAISFVNLEASACGTPTITTRETGLFDWEEGGGLLIGADADELANALERAFAWPDDERRERGQASRALIARRYSWKAVLPDWQALYGDIAR